MAFKSDGDSMPEIERLLVITHVVHYQYNDQLFAYEPYVRELDRWARLFPELFIASPCCREVPPGDCAPFVSRNISIIPQLKTGGRTFTSAVIQLLATPIVMLSLARAMMQVDAVHVRCPGNFGLLGALMAPIFTRYRIAKFAGQWDGYPGERLSVKFQRKVLRSGWWRAPVTVYGEWPNQPKNIVPFFTSIMTTAEMQFAETVVKNRNYSFTTINILYVGRLTIEKNISGILAVTKKLVVSGLPVHLKIVGEGPHRSVLEATVREQEIAERVTFSGGLCFDDVAKAYEKADVLILVSDTEGWPKAITEAMAFGVVCIGANHGILPKILGEGRGFVVDPEDTSSITDIIRDMPVNSDRFRQISQNAAAWARNYTMEGLQDALRQLLETAWKVKLNRCR